MARYAISGATGLLGGALTDALRADGHEVARITRRPVDESDIGWDPPVGQLDTSRLEGLDGLVHFAGEPIGAARWTPSTRRRIIASRVVTTRLLADACTRLDAPPAVFVSASAVGFYGDRGDEVLTEDAGAGDDFLAAVCRQWESAARPAADAGIRVVHPRTGVVIAAQGPLIDKVRLPFRLGIGGRIGSGRQYVPWIARADHVRAVRHLLVDDLEGPVNVVGPEPVTNRELTRALGKAFHRPAVLPIPVLAVRALYGQMGVALATVSQRVVPQRLVDSGFAFSVASLDDALAVALGD